MIRFLLVQLFLIILMWSKSISIPLSNVSHVIPLPNAACSVSDGVRGALSTGLKVQNLYASAIEEVSFMQLYGSECLKFDQNSKVLLKKDLSNRGANGFADTNIHRLNEVWYGDRAIMDDAHVYHDGRTIDSDLVALQTMAGIFPYIADKYRKTKEQYRPNSIKSVIKDSETTFMQASWAISSNDIWVEYPSVPRQSLPECKGFTSLCMIGLLPNQTYGEYYLGNMNSTLPGPGYAYYGLTTPVNNPKRIVQFTPVYIWNYGTLVR